MLSYAQRQISSLFAIAQQFLDTPFLLDDWAGASGLRRLVRGCVTGTAIRSVLLAESPLASRRFLLASAASR